MAPPELAADTPVLNIFKPYAISRLILFRHEADEIVHHGLERNIGKMLHADEPLEAQTGLDDHFGALAVANLISVVLNLFHQSGGF